MERNINFNYCFVLRNIINEELVYFDMEISYHLLVDIDNEPKKIDKIDNIEIPDSYIKYNEFNLDGETSTLDNNLNKEKINFFSFFRYIKTLDIYPSLLENNKIGAENTPFFPIKIGYESIDNGKLNNVEKYLKFFNDNVVEIYEYKSTENDFIEMYNDGTEVTYSEFAVNQLSSDQLYDDVKVDFIVGLDRYFFEVKKILNSNKNLNLNIYTN